MIVYLVDDRWLMITRIGYLLDYVVRRKAINVENNRF